MAVQYRFCSFLLVIPSACMGSRKLSGVPFLLYLFLTFTYMISRLRTSFLQLLPLAFCWLSDYLTSWSTKTFRWYDITATRRDYMSLLGTELT